MTQKVNTALTKTFGDQGWIPAISQPVLWPAQGSVEKGRSAEKMGEDTGEVSASRTYEGTGGKGQS
ncbi:hypothetical protein FH972_012904 [Carpinus fangiana]|uniref:Uncharacterized protein n=1 Tax=Carpinus fangiana TaxID=176857 RepID=A0A5N6R8F5_9ROSI|nr:hypothetical protein FH972_012904 [Carpinus fangiana]